MSAKKPRIPVQCKECGAMFETTATRLASGRGRYCSRTCGNRATSRRHGHTTKTGQSRTYNTWATMIQRCSNPKNPKYPWYGGAGITVCGEWLSFEVFLADMGERPEGTTLDRRDSSKGYSKDNCRWATPAEQQSHLRNNVIIQYGGETFHLSALARHLGVEFSTLKFRVRKGWPQAKWGDPPRPTALRRKRPASTTRVHAPAGELDL